MNLQLVKTYIHSMVNIWPRALIYDINSNIIVGKAIDTKYISESLYVLECEVDVDLINMKDFCDYYMKGYDIIYAWDILKIGDVYRHKEGR